MSESKYFHGIEESIDLTFMLIVLKIYKTTSVFYKTTNKAVTCAMPLDGSPYRSHGKGLFILHSEPTSQRTSIYTSGSLHLMGEQLTEESGTLPT